MARNEIPGPVGLADLADLRHRDPARAGEQAMAWTESPDPGEASIASWIVGLAEHELGRPDQAITWFDRAAVIALEAGRNDDRARARASAAISHLALGQQAVAERSMTEAISAAGPSSRGMVQFLAGLLLQRTGHLQEASSTYQKAERALRRINDDASLARLHLNRGTLRAYQGEIRAAIGDFDVCEYLAERLDLPVLAAMAAHNSGFALGRFGDVPAALAAFDRAALAYRTLGDPGGLTGVLAADRGEVLLAAGLLDEAREAAATALDRLSHVDDLPQRHEALLHAAQADLAAGDTTRARERAMEAAAGFRSTGRRAWGSMAEYTALQAEVSETEHEAMPSANLLTRSLRVARELAQHGWPVEAAHARTFVARMALARGRLDLAREILAETPPSRRSGPAVQIQSWHGTALLRLAEGDRAGASRAVRRGLAVVDDHREALGAAELRANASALGSDLARLGLAVALEGGRPAQVLAAAERHRAASLRIPAVRPPHDRQLADALSALRQAEADKRAAVLEGRPFADSTATLNAAERRVRDVSRLTRGSSRSRFRSPTLTALRAALEDRVLVSYVTMGADLHAVTVGRGGARLVSLGDIRAAEVERNHLVSALRRALRTLLDPDGAGGGNEPRSRRPDRKGIERPGDQKPREVEVPSTPHHALIAVDLAAERLDDLLIAPLGLPERSELVIVPTAFGHGTPWAALPSLQGRGVTIAPSANLWLKPRRHRRRTDPLLVAGPDLEGAEPEVRAIRGVWGAGRLLIGPAATVDAVLDGFNGTDLVHIAAHGTFRSDSPLFSSLRVSDGPLTVFDLERVRSAPATVVLPACSAAAVSVRAGDELLGTTAALLGVGVVNVIAPVQAVPDHATVQFSLELHRHLASGALPSVATALATASMRDAGDPLSRVAASCFICVGADDRSLPGVR